LTEARSGGVETEPEISITIGISRSVTKMSKSAWVSHTSKIRNPLPVKPALCISIPFGGSSMAPRRSLIAS